MDKINIGKIVNTHGIKGEIRIKSDFDKKSLAFRENQKLIINNSEFTVNTYRVHKGFDMITFKEFNDINQVLPFKGKLIYIDRDKLELKSDDYILDDLIDMEVLVNDEVIGTVLDYSNDINPLLKVNGQKIFYIPLKGNYIERVDIANNKLFVIPETKELII